MKRDTKRELLLKGHELALKHGVGKLTIKMLTKATGFYHCAVTAHYGTIGQFRDAVHAHGIEKGTIAADADVRPVRMSPADRHAQILDCAFDLAAVEGLGRVNLTNVAEKVGVTGGLISRYFGTRQGLLDAVLAKAVMIRHLDIIADAIELRLSTTHVPPDLLAQANKILAAA